MSREQLDTIIGMLRGGAGPDLTQPAAVARQQFQDMLAAIPGPEGVDFESSTVGGVPAVWSRTAGASQQHVLLYLHGGGYVIGDSWGYRPLWSGLAAATGARGLGLDYRLAPEHRFPAAVDDAVAGYRGLLDAGYAPGSIVLAGDSAGGGLIIAALLEARRLGLPLPAAALAISPWTDLEFAGESIAAKAAEDPSLTLDGLVNCARQYLDGRPANEPLASPIHADLAGLPPLLIQVGSVEILLDDSVRLARQAGAAGVDVRLEIWPEMPHVWHAFGFMLEEGAAAVAQAAGFLKTHLKS
jgi:monoterpene epsilon-lactone hydrolase